MQMDLAAFAAAVVLSLAAGAFGAPNGGTLGNGPLKLELDAARPCVTAWRWGDVALGGSSGRAPEIEILSVADSRVHSAGAEPFHTVWSLKREGESRAVYRADISAGGKPAVSLELAFAVDGSRAEVSLGRVSETNGYQLVRVSLGRVVAAAGDGARMALPTHAGRLVDPAATVSAATMLRICWDMPVLAGIVYDRRLLCAADLSGVDDQLVVSVGKDRAAALGVSFEHRVPGNGPHPSLLLSEGSAMRLRFARPDGGAPDWTDGARLLRAEVSARPLDLYRQSFLYKIFCDAPGAKRFVTFDQAAGLIHRIRRLTDGAPQVAYLVGWQHRGHDTGYPDVFTVNPRLGGLDGLKKAAVRAAADNAILSFHDNYDDAYTNSPSWNPGLVARSPDGGLMKGGIWAGGQAYVQSFSAPAVEVARERVRRTLAMLPVRSSYHIDVLSAQTVLHDFNPASPASGAQSLQGKIAIVREFNRHGVDVTSEAFSAPFIGVIGHAWHLVNDHATLFTGERRIPFTPFVYHGHASYGGGQPNQLADALLDGCAQSSDFTLETPLREITDRYYLIEIPWFLFRSREMTGYSESGGFKRASYGPDSFVEVSDDGTHARVVADGRVIQSDGNVFVPNFAGNAWLAYSRSGGEAEFPAPEGWTDAAAIRAIVLTAEGPAGAAVPVTLAGGRVRLRLPPAEPVRLSRANGR